MDESKHANRETTAEKGLLEPIAIIGMACRLPGRADSPEKFWHNLLDGKDAITEIPRERWDADEYYDPNPDAAGKCVTRRGAFLENVDRFDANFFGIPPRTAKLIDPQQRLLCEVAWEAIENSGLSVSSLNGSNTGVFVGLWGIDYWHRVMSREYTTFNGYEWSGNMHSSASGYLAYFLGFTGPSMSLDTACSTSLVATHLAVRHLQTGECDLAVAGAVNLCLSPGSFIVLSRSTIIAPDGRCKTFDASADGYARGEGCGVVVLKRYSDALRDRDPILALIRGTAVNSDGHNSGMAVPNPETQKIVIRRALENAQVDPLDVDYVEAHGTGTRVGDPIEVEAITDVYCERRDPSNPLLLGAVKGNIGHLETASGIAGLIKTVLVLQGEVVPPNLHFRDPNPAIPWSDLPVRVPTAQVPWPRSNRPRFAGVSAFGASGTNAHIVLEEAPRPAETKRDSGAERTHRLLAISAKTEPGLQELSRTYAHFLGEHSELSIGDVCYTASVGRAHFRARRAVVGASADEIRERLAEPLRLPARDGVELRVGFLFTGQGSQYPGMGRKLYEASTAFREAIDRCDEILRPKLDSRLLQVLFPSSSEESPIDTTAYAQPALFAVEFALAELWRSWGITPAIVLGHSVGEYVAACVAGVFSLEDALRLVAERGRLMQQLPRVGKMFSILASEERVLDRFNGANLVRIAAVNGPESVVISGESEAVAAIAESLSKEGIAATELNVSHAFHSPLMEPMLGAFRTAAESVSYAPPRVPLVSNVTGVVAGNEVTSPDYWVDHVLRPVRFSDGVRTLFREGATAALEVGPKPTLSSLGRASVAESDAAWLASLKPGVDDLRQMLSSLGALYEAGASVDWQGLARDDAAKRVVVPTYPFQRQRFWIEEEGSSLAPAREDNLVARLAGAGSAAEASAKLRESGIFGDDEATLVGKLLGVLGEEIERRSKRGSGVVSEYYDALAASLSGLGQQSQDGTLATKAVLNFVPFPEPIEGFAWPLVLAFPDVYPERLQMILDAQKALRRALFRSVDWSRVKKVLDFGCGYGTDVIRIASEHPDVELAGYTISPEQADFGREEAKKRGVSSQVSIFHRDSTCDEFPSERDLVLGFEVACHIRDKHALFGNVSRNLNDGGLILLADFVARTDFEIAHDETSSYLSTADQWARVFADNSIGIVDVVDVGKNVGYFLEDPDFEAHLAKAPNLQQDENIVTAFRSYDRLGRMLTEGLTSYVLMTSRKRSDLARAELYRSNLDRLTKPLLYGEVFEDDWTYALEWTPRERSQETGRKGKKAAVGTHLILSDDGGCGRSLARLLKESGGNPILVSRGDRFGKTGGGEYPEWTLREKSEEDYERLVQEVFSAKAPSVRSVVHLFGLDARVEDDGSVEDLSSAVFSSCGTAQQLTRALARKKPSSPRLWLVTRNAVATGDGAARLPLAQSALWGYGRVVSLEHPELWGGLVDLGNEPVDSAAERLALEIEDSQGEDQLALSVGKRFVARLVRRSLPSAAMAELSPEASYLVTGGLGALGLRAARWLVSLGAKNLVLMGRSGAKSDGGREGLHELERAGCRVRVEVGDVAESADVERVFAAIAREQAPLRGVVHAAGIAAFDRIQGMTWPKMESVLRAKVAGAWNLDRFTRELSLDFFVCFSSISSVWGTEGAAHYAAANAFLDAYAHDRRARGREVSSVNWGPWAGGGMATEAFLDRLALLGVSALPPQESIELLGRLLRAESAQTVVARVDWDRFKEVYGLRGRRRLFDEVGKASTAATPAVAVPARTSASIDRDSIGAYIRQKVGALLGFSDTNEVDVRSPLVELGFDSLMAVRLRNALKSDLGLDVPIGELFVSASLDKLEDALQEQIALGQVIASPNLEPSEGVDVEAL